MGRGGNSRAECFKVLPERCGNLSGNLKSKILGHFPPTVFLEHRKRIHRLPILVVHPKM
jgi:hypothetical protein